MFSNKKNQRGIALYLTLLIMSLLLGIALGISTLFVDQLKSLRQAGYSAFALEAADSGIEKIFYDSQKGVNVLLECPDNGGVPPPACTQILANGASYVIVVDAPGAAACPANVVSYCAKSSGSFQSALRAIRIAR